MKKKTLLRLLALLLIPHAAFSQTPPPPPPPPPPPLAPASASEQPPVAPASAPAEAPTAPTSAGAAATARISASETSASAKAPSAAQRADKAREKWDDSRALALAVGNTLGGPTGLVRIISADSGDPGTLRLSVTESYFSGNGFLCPNCETPSGSTVTRADSVRVSSQRLQLSVTPIDFLEAHAALRYRQASNNRGDPRVMQISDDFWFGAKGFTQRVPGRVWSVGGGLNLGLLSKAGAVGTGAANVSLHAEATLDLTRREKHEDAIPVRAHLNLGYLFDSSGALADDIESKRSAALGSRQRITRIERFGFDISRVDSVRLGLGVEGVFRYVRPFAEWTIDIPANRQGYLCRRSSLSAGDQCLVRGKGFDTTPSRVTLGVRGYPAFSSWSEGLGLLAAVDIGTGATSSFVDEVTPELPWSLHLGLAYAFDTRPRIERVLSEKVVQVRIPPQPAQYIEGSVVDAKNGEPIALASVLFKDTDRTGMITDASGHFHTPDLKEGVYTFRVTKDGYTETECAGTVVKAAPPAPAGALRQPSERTGADPDPSPGARVTQVKCELSELSKAGRIDGVIRDSETTQYVASASVQAVDARGRTLSLRTNDQGSFRFENVPPGAIRLQVEAEGYLPNAAELELKVRDTVSVQLTLHKRPKLSNVIVTKKELKLRKQVHFLHDSSEILPDSQSLVEEIAEALRTRPEIVTLEIQGHTDNTGAPDHNQALSERRANAVRGALVLLGIEPNRLIARGYGQEQPLVPNTNAANKAKNRRVQLMIQGQ